jgi:hypothetical protein
MRAALAALNDEFERTWRVTVNAPSAASPASSFTLT